jgi:glycerophosphoryl diester phosphodiesterase
MNQATIMIHPSKLVAHRGYQANYPENTALSLSKAIEVGALFIELDIQFSGDRLPIIYHDTDLQRVSGQSGSVFTMSRAELMGCSAYEPQRLGDTFIGEKISPLEALVDILMANPDVTAFVELKEDSIKHCGRALIIASVQEILRPVAEQTVLMSFDYPLVIAAREADWPWVGVVLQSWNDLGSAQVAQARPDYIYTNYTNIPENCDLTTIQALNDAVLVTYEVATQELGQQLLARQVDMLETFEIEAMQSPG